MGWFPFDEVLNEEDDAVDMDRIFYRCVYADFAVVKQASAKKKKAPEVSKETAIKQFHSLLMEKVRVPQWNYNLWFLCVCYNRKYAVHFYVTFVLSANSCEVCGALVNSTLSERERWRMLEKLLWNWSAAVCWRS